MTRAVRLAEPPAATHAPGLPSPARRVPTPASPTRTAGPSAPPPPGAARAGSRRRDRVFGPGLARLPPPERVLPPATEPRVPKPRQRPALPAGAARPTGLRTPYGSAHSARPPRRRSAAAQVRRELRAAATPLRLQHPFAGSLQQATAPARFYPRLTAAAGLRRRQLLRQTRRRGQKTADALLWTQAIRLEQGQT